MIWAIKIVLTQLRNIKATEKMMWHKLTAWWALLALINLSSFRVSVR